MSFLKSKLFLTAALMLLLLSPLTIFAQDNTENEGYRSGLITVSSTVVSDNLIVPIGTGADRLTSNRTDPGKYINTLYKWGIGLAALLALGQLVLGGVLYTLSAGSLGSREAATERMKNGVTGLILLIAGVTLLVTINPELVNLKPLGVSNIRTPSRPTENGSQTAVTTENAVSNTAVPDITSVFFSPAGTPANSNTRQAAKQALDQDPTSPSTCTRTIEVITYQFLRWLSTSNIDDRNEALQRIANALRVGVDSPADPLIAKCERAAVYLALDKLYQINANAFSNLVPFVQTRLPGNTNDKYKIKDLLQGSL